MTKQIETLLGTVTLTETEISAVRDAGPRMGLVDNEDINVHTRLYKKGLINGHSWLTELGEHVRSAIEA